MKAFKGVYITSTSDCERLYEASKTSQKRISNLLTKSGAKGLHESDVVSLRRQLTSEARRLERVVIVEAATAQDFYQVQKHFRSLLRASNVLTRWFKGSYFATKLEMLQVQGVELLNDLYEHIKDLEGNERNGLPGVDRHVLRGDPSLAKKRDQFVKVFADFAVLFRGSMALADLFSDDPASIGGYNDIRSIFASLEREQQMSEPLKQGLAYVDHYAAEVNPKKGFAGIFGSKSSTMTSKFRNAITKAVSTSSPGFSKFIDLNELVDYLMSKSPDQLTVIFGRFNDYIANDADVDWLLSVTKNSRTIGSLFKSVFDAFSGGSMRSMTR